MNHSISITMWAVSLLLVTAPVSWAEEADIDALKQEVETLKAKNAEVEQLKHRLAEIKKQLAEVEEVEEKRVTLSGTLKLNYAYKNFDRGSKDRGGDLTMGNFRLGFDADINDILLSVQYRWYPHMDTIHHGWIGHEFSDSLQLQFGITRVPFGILPCASHSYWYGITYYLGLEDDYDFGLNLLFKPSPHDLRVAFSKNGEWGSSSNLERYSYDVVRDSTNFPSQSNEEINQLNARYTYLIDHGEEAHTELGVSGQWGQLYNRTIESCGYHWAAGCHLNGDYGPVNLMLEAIRYEYDPKNPPAVDDATVLMGAFDGAYLVAAKGYVYVAGVSYDVPMKWGSVTKLTFYNDYSILMKDEDGFKDSVINTLGCKISAGAMYAWLDIIMGRNAMYLGGPADSFGAGESDADWDVRYNISIGYYF